MSLKHLFSKHAINYLSSRFINGRASSFYTKLSGITDCILSNTYGGTLSKHSTIHLLWPSHLVFNTRTIHSYKLETRTGGFDDVSSDLFIGTAVSNEISSRFPGVMHGKLFEAYGSDNVTNDLVESYAISNEFLSRFCWVMRGKMFEAFKEWHEKIIYDSLKSLFPLAMSYVESKYLDRIIASVMVTPSSDIYADDWRMLNEVCDACLASLSRHSPSRVMLKFAYAADMERDILTELYREIVCSDFPQNKFHSELEHIRGNDQIRKAAKTDYIDGEEGHVSLPSGKLKYKDSRLGPGEESFRMNERGYSNLSDAHFMLNYSEDAERITKKVNEGVILPNIHTFSTVIDVYIKAGKLECAKETFESALSRKLIPDIEVINAMMMAYVSAGYPELGESLLKEMESRHIQLTENIYMVLLRSFARRGDAEGANRISCAMESAGFQPTLESCTLLVEAYGKAGEVDLARKHFDQISKLGYKPDRGSIIKMLLAYQKYGDCCYNEGRILLEEFPLYF